MPTRRQIRRELDRLAEIVEATAERRERYMREAETGKRVYHDQGFICTGIGSVGTCTNTALYLANRLGGEVWGYAIEDNPHAEVGKEEFGHDFAIIDDRWLVDFWARDTYQLRDLYDLHNPKDAAIVKRRYGPRENWVKMSREDFSKAVEWAAEIKEPD